MITSATVDQGAFALRAGNLSGGTSKVALALAGREAESPGADEPTQGWTWGQS
jgi:hypothetical protein